MTVAVQTRIVRIGNSQGVRIPKPLLQQAGISDRVELQVHDGHLSIHPLRQARAGWAARFAAMAAEGDDQLLDGAQPIPTVWDEEEWEW
jgi:antitoxin MazE